MTEPKLRMTRISVADEVWRSFRAKCFYAGTDVPTAIGTLILREVKLWDANRPSTYPRPAALRKALKG